MCVEHTQNASSSFLTFEFVDQLTSWCRAIGWGEDELSLTSLGENVVL